MLAFIVGFCIFLAFVSIAIKLFGIVNEFPPAIRALIKPLMWSGAALIVFLFKVVTANIITINSGYYGVKYVFGNIKPAVIEPGVHVTIPYIDRIVIWNGRLFSTDGTASSATQDIQIVDITWNVAWGLDKTKIPMIASKVGDQQWVDDRFLNPIVQRSIKTITARYKAEELITQRDKVATEIIDMVRHDVDVYGIHIEQVNLTNIGFKDTFTDAIEAKQQATQLVLKAQQDLERIRVESAQKVSQAEAEAKSLSLQKAAVSDELIRLRTIEASVKAIEKWDGVMPQYSCDTLPWLNIDGKSLGKK